ncbi:hypothetical protein EDC01DRAFT_627525 [Geopyxis carbonaria]|nr:hypothetical protein EDC01DRAFT_627525 [Geopyxis carbonaria]
MNNPKYSFSDNESPNPELFDKYGRLFAGHQQNSSAYFKSYQSYVETKSHAVPPSNSAASATSAASSANKSFYHPPPPRNGRTNNRRQNTPRVVPTEPELVPAVLPPATKMQIWRLYRALDCLNYQVGGPGWEQERFDVQRVLGWLESKHSRYPCFWLSMKMVMHPELGLIRWKDLRRAWAPAIAEVEAMQEWEKEQQSR